MGAGRQDSEEDASNAADLMQSIDKATIVPDELTKYLLGTVGVDFEVRVHPTLCL